MPVPHLSRVVLEELQQELAEEDIKRGLHRLSEVIVLEDAVLTSSEAKAQWCAIGARADKGRGTLVKRRDGVTLLIVPFTKAVQMASTTRSGRTMGDIRRAYPGVSEPEAPLINAPGGRAWAPVLPDPTSE
jgi:hypothetical protein